jgi:predicted amidohydrolase YtcJ
MPLLVRNVEVDGRIADIAIVGGRIDAIGPNLSGEEVFDARGGAAIPGLHDHHLHLLATAAQRDSVPLDDCRDFAAVADRLRQADAARPRGTWLRATGYHEGAGPLIDRTLLDAILPDRPLRIQHQTGSLWVLNSAALARTEGDDWPPMLERDSSGVPTGRLYRGDAWLSGRVGAEIPPLGPLGAELAAFGITGVCDATVSTDPERATLLADGVRSGALPVRLLLMSGGPLDLPDDGAYAVGPVKIVLDDHRLPAVEEVVAIIRRARSWRRPVAAHCVTAGELAVMIAALEEAGACPGDRIEHGNVVPPSAIPLLSQMGLIVVSQPGFIHRRGDRYLASVSDEDRPDLFRAASLLSAGVRMAGSSDAPYGPLDPWLAMRAARERRTASGRPLGPDERIDAATALNVFLSPLEKPGAAPRRLAPGAPADLCVLRVSLAQQLALPSADHVALTIRAGQVTFLAE